MKIVFYMTTILEHGGGLEKYFIETAKTLTKFPNIKVDIVTMDDNFSYKIINLLSFYYFKKIKREILYKESINNIKQRLGEVNYLKCKNLKELKNKLNEYDVIYSKNELLEALIFKFIIRYMNIPTVIFGCHTPVYYPIAGSIQSKLHNFLYNGFVYRFLAGSVRKFHVTNNFDLAALKRLFPKKEVIKIYNPFNIEQFNSNLKKYKYKFDWDKSKFNVLWIARLTEQKGVDDLIEIIDTLNKTYYKHKINWNIIGDGVEIKKILYLKKRWNNINYFGYIENSYMASIYQENDLFISTSKWESFPYNILEAQASGMPVVAFNIPGSKDIIENSITGFLVDNKNDFVWKITSLLDKDEKFSREKIVKIIRNKFNPNRIYEELGKIFTYM